ARAAARKALAEMRLGRDPQEERRDRRDRDKVTLRAVVAEYLGAKQGELRPHTMREITRYLTTPPYFGPLFRAPIDTITRPDVALRLVAIIRWTPHDLRRTLSTRLHDIGVAPHVVEAVLNHRSGHRSGVAGVYNRATYEREMRIALARWEDHIRTLVEGGERKVFVLPQQLA